MFGRQSAVLGIALSCAIGCGDERTSSSFEQTAPDSGTGRQLEAMWHYRSPEVDVDILLVTVDDEDGCHSTARLEVDEAIAGTDVYRMPATDCAELRLSDEGDLVLLDSPTGHDWSDEALDVDTDREIIRLGPWYDEDSGVEYRFTLAAPECGDCECPKLDRHAGEEVLTLEFARRCD